MPNLSIKNVPPAILEKLRQQAASNHRSLQGELMALLFRAVGEREDDDTASAGAGQTTASGTMDIDDVFRSMKRRFPEGSGEPYALDIIRAERDSR